MKTEVKRFRRSLAIILIFILAAIITQINSFAAQDEAALDLSDKTVGGGAPTRIHELTASAAGDTDLTVLAFTSDVHNDQNNYLGQTRLGTWIDNIKSKYSKIEIQVCPDTGFARANTIRKVVGKKKRSAKIGGLAGKTTYYVRVRNVKGSGTGKTVSKWSKPKKIRIK